MGMLHFSCLFVARLEIERENQTLPSTCVRMHFVFCAIYNIDGAKEDDNKTSECSYQHYCH